MPESDHELCAQSGALCGDATSYFAFLDTFGLTPGLVHEYTVYAKIGTLAELRAAFTQLHQAGL